MLSSSLFLSLSLISLLTSLALALARKCNGFEELCDRKYSNISHVGSHNSAFVGTFEIPIIGSYPANNQGWEVREQLENGIRFMTAQVHWDTDVPTADLPAKRAPFDLGGIIDDATEEVSDVVDDATEEVSDAADDVEEVVTNPGEVVDDIKESVGGEAGLKLCHTSCLEKDAEWLKDYLSTLKAWLDDNPDEVFTLLLTNPDSRNVSDFDAIFKEVGLDTYTFVPSTSPEKLAMEAWPTLGQLLDDGTRLIVFMDYHMDESAVPYIMDEFKYFFETIFDTTDETFTSCDIHRPDDKNPDGKMYIVNHYLDVDLLPGDEYELLIPKFTDIDAVNAVDGESGIVTQASACAGSYDRQPNVMLLDYVNKGSPFEAEDVMNGLAA